MAILIRKDLAKIEDSNYWSSYRKWISYPHNWIAQGIHEGSRKVIQ